MIAINFHTQPLTWRKHENGPGGDDWETGIFILLIGVYLEDLETHKSCSYSLLTSCVKWPFIEMESGREGYGWVGRWPSAEM